MNDSASPNAQLTDRELELLKLVATGASNQQIALQLYISVNTVKVHLRNIFQKLGVESRTEATMYAVRQGWVVLEGLEVQLEEEEVIELPEARLPAWQRLLFVVASAVLAVLVLNPPSPMALVHGGSAFTDLPGGPQESGLTPGSARWESRAGMPTARARLATVAWNGKVYAIAGDTADGVSAAVEIYDPSTDTWTRGSSKPRPVRNVSAAVLNGRIFVPGGFSPLDQAMASVETYDPVRDTWEEAPALPAPLFGYAIVAVGDKLYLFGGSDGIAYSDSVWIYDPNEERWISGTPLRKARAFLSAAVSDERVYLFGGYDGNEEFALCESYDPAAESAGKDPWKALTPMTETRGGLASVAVDESVYILGGGWTGYLSYNERYDIATDTWAQVDTPLLGQWRNLGAALIDNPSEAVVYAVGGWSGRYLSDNQAYTAVFRVFLPGFR